MNDIFRYILSGYLDINDKRNILKVSIPEEFNIANMLGIDLRYDKEYALRYASVNGHLPVVEFLVNKDADIHVCNDYPIILACINGHRPVVEFLISKGADKTVVVDEFGLEWAHNNGFVN